MQLAKLLNALINEGRGGFLVSDTHAAAKQHLKLLGKGGWRHSNRGRHAGCRCGQRRKTCFGGIRASTGGFAGKDGDVIIACWGLPSLPQRTDDLRDLGLVSRRKELVTAPTNLYPMQSWDHFVSKQDFYSFSLHLIPFSFSFIAPSWSIPLDYWIHFFLWTLDCYFLHIPSKQNVYSYPHLNMCFLFVFKHLMCKLNALSLAQFVCLCRENQRNTERQKTGCPTHAFIYRSLLQHQHCIFFFFDNSTGSTTRCKQCTVIL